MGAGSAPPCLQECVKLLKDLDNKNIYFLTPVWQLWLNTEHIPHIVNSVRLCVCVGLEWSRERSLFNSADYRLYEGAREKGGGEGGIKSASWAPVLTCPTNLDTKNNVTSTNAQFFYSFIPILPCCHTWNTNNFTVCRKGQNSVTRHDLCFTMFLQADIPANHARRLHPTKSLAWLNCWVWLANCCFLNNSTLLPCEMAWCLRYEVNITWCLTFGLMFTTASQIHIVSYIYPSLQTLTPILNRLTLNSSGWESHHFPGLTRRRPSSFIYSQMV